MGLHMVSLATSMKPIATSCKVIALKDEPLWYLRKEFTCIRKQKHKYVTMNSNKNQFYTTLVINGILFSPKHAEHGTGYKLAAIIAYAIYKLDHVQA